MILAIPRVASRATVAIRCALQGGARVRLRVLDARGRQVAELWNGPRDAGRFLTIWSSEGHGGRVAPGVYFALLEAGGRSRVRRFVLIR